MLERVYIKDTYPLQQQKYTFYSLMRKILLVHGCSLIIRIFKSWLFKKKYCDKAFSLKKSQEQFRNLEKCLLAAGKAIAARGTAFVCEAFQGSLGSICEAFQGSLGSIFYMQC